MRARGITYDTGFVRDGLNSLERFDPDAVRRELTIIRDDLHCNAVQIIGGDPRRLEFAARIAADLGLEVWFSPYPLDLATDEILELFVDCAERAERLRASGAEVVFVAGVELTIMNRGFVDGDRLEERLEPPAGRPGRPSRTDRRGPVPARRLPAHRPWQRSASASEARSPTPPSRSSGVDWAPFDFVTLELIRSAEVADRFRDGVRSLVAEAKPVAITGFGTATWRGAGDVAPAAWRSSSTTRPPASRCG